MALPVPVYRLRVQAVFGHLLLDGGAAAESGWDGHDTALADPSPAEPGA